MKKAQVEIQFNWVFVLIVGAVLLGFFFMMISSQSQKSDTSISMSLARTLSSILDSTAQKSGTVKEYVLPSGFNLEFQCDSTQNLFNYKLNGIKAADIKYDVIFAPKELIGNNIYTWTKEWELPDEQGLSITTFLYVTNKNQGYFFYNESSYNFELLYSQFPKNLSVHLGNTEQLDQINTRANYKFSTFIKLCEEEDCGEDYVEAGDNSKHIFINPTESSNIFKSGTVYYCETASDYPDGKCTNTQYLGSASLYAALFSDDKDFYECMMNKAFDKLRITSILQYEKINLLNEASSLSTSCKNYLGLIVLEGPHDWLPELFDEDAFLDDPFSNIQDISDTLNQIQKRNQALALEKNCIELY